MRWQFMAYRLGVVVNSLLPVALLPEPATRRFDLSRALDRWAQAHFGR